MVGEDTATSRAMDGPSDRKLLLQEYLIERQQIAIEFIALHEA